MHLLEPYYNWRHIYIASEDGRSPFFEREYSEFEFTNQIYNFLLHPQWDDIGSPGLFIKILYADYIEGSAIIELIGIWNDLLHNDIMVLKRDIVDHLVKEGINKFVLIGENLLDFHYDTDDYYQEWFEDVEDGWICLVNFRQHVLTEMKKGGTDYYLISGGELDDLEWRKYQPSKLIQKIENIINHRLS